MEIKTMNCNRAELYIKWWEKKCFLGEEENKRRHPPQYFCLVHIELQLIGKDSPASDSSFSGKICNQPGTDQ